MGLNIAFLDMPVIVHAYRPLSSFSPVASVSLPIAPPLSHSLSLSLSLSLFSLSPSLPPSLPPPLPLLTHKPPTGCIRSPPVGATTHGDRFVPLWSHADVTESGNNRFRALAPRTATEKIDHNLLKMTEMMQLFNTIEYLPTHRYCFHSTGQFSRICTSYVFGLGLSCLNS